MMNERAATLGLSDTTHFTNCVGLFDNDHYSTCYDMAMIMHAAINNQLCREVMSTRIYTTTPTDQHPNGIEISNWFLRRAEEIEFAESKNAAANNRPQSQPAPAAGNDSFGGAADDGFMNIPDGVDDDDLPFN